MATPKRAEDSTGTLSGTKFPGGTLLVNEVATDLDVGTVDDGNSERASGGSSPEFWKHLGRDSDRLV